jgi:hypothetical protein
MKMQNMENKSEISNSTSPFLIQDIVPAGYLKRSPSKPEKEDRIRRAMRKWSGGKLEENG